MISGLSEVSFSDERRDLLDTAFSRVLGQFRTSPVYLQFLATLIAEAQELHSALVDLQEGRTILGASGSSLDGLGRIVGKPRVGYQYSEANWLFADRGGQGADQVDAWCVGSPMESWKPAGDQEYKTQIYTRAICNHARFGSVPELLEMARLVTGAPVSFERIGPMSARLLVPTGISLTALNLLLSFSTTQQVDDIPAVPYPATLSIDDVLVFLPIKFFCADRPDQGTDSAPVAVGAVRGAYG